MSRTYRRRGRRHNYDWVLRDSRWVSRPLYCRSGAASSRSRWWKN